MPPPFDVIRPATGITRSSNERRPQEPRRTFDRLKLHVKLNRPRKMRILLGKHEPGTACSAAVKSQSS